MKGIIFTTFNDMVEEKYGLATWEALLTKVQPKSKGIYTVGAIYEDEELLKLIKGLAELKHIKTSDLIEEFGIYTFPVLAKKYPVFIIDTYEFKDFLKSINNIIHVEVKKLYPEANLPTIKCEEVKENQLIMHYSSPRKLCHLAIGLIRGASNYYQKTVEIKQLACMHEGADYCILEINIGKEV